MFGFYFDGVGLPPLRPACRQAGSAQPDKIKNHVSGVFCFTRKKCAGLVNFIDHVFFHLIDPSPPAGGSG